MKPTAIADLRMRLLKRALDSSLAEAIGIMEVTWHFAAEWFPSGRIPLASAALLCAYADYQYDSGPDDLMHALHTASWGSFDGDDFVLTDWDQHRPSHLGVRQRKAASRDTTAKPPPNHDHVTGHGVVEPGVNGTCHVTVTELRGRGEGGVGVSEECAQGEGFRLQTEEAKPPKKASAKPKAAVVTVDQVQIPEELDRPSVVSALEEWLVYKRKRGQSYKDPAYVTKLLSQFTEDPPGVFEASVDYTIGQGWSGLFRPGNRPTPRDTNQTRRQLAANAFDQVEKELGQ